VDWQRHIRRRSPDRLDPRVLQSPGFADGPFVAHVGEIAPGDAVDDGPGEDEARDRADPDRWRLATCSGMVFFAKPPNASNPTGREGLVQQAAEQFGSKLAAAERRLPCTNS
jgi:hypothetical protein